MVTGGLSAVAGMVLERFRTLFAKGVFLPLLLLLLLLLLLVWAHSLVSFST